MLAGLRGVAFKFLRSNGMPMEEVEEFIAATKHEFEFDLLRGYNPWYVYEGTHIERSSDS